MERMSLFTILVHKFKMSTIIKDNRIRTRFIKIPMDVGSNLRVTYIFI